ncbi:ChaN family lipoprotein [Sphingobacterium sp. UT-1RO-CII-1]|uniref:ChaN family lipoprotein n=1 Tax=Sphingobacterium sp. UT-1RO-CII-1 TaxID=2995225 RepID=UPI00227A3F41|nr:ChaN family lipoprotein [Sphingobacterium sp. UT-1RO-CII-1]MCY4779783.1 ChaN family lipoprotein [Sphingobacterium sp. UT-1RO-CII-1]
MKKLLLFYLITPIYLSAQKDPLYKVYNTADKKEITLDQLIKEISLAQVVFFGEEHNDSVAHVLQLEVFKGLHNIHGKNISLSMEMFQTDVQLVLNEYLAGQITEKNLLVDARPWQNYKDYRPLVEYAKSNGIYVLAANAPSRYTNRVTRHGVQSLKELSTEGKKLIAPLPIDTLTGRYYEKFVGLLGGHAGMGNMKIYQSQNVWDATMASKIAKLAKKRSIKQVLHLNGRFHTDEKLGTYAQLQRYGRKLKLINISSFSHDNLDAPSWASWEHLGDYVILTASSVQKTF